MRIMLNKPAIIIPRQMPITICIGQETSVHHKTPLLKIMPMSKL